MPLAVPSFADRGMISQGLAIVRALFLKRRYFFHLVALIFLAELCLGLLIIWKVPYTKIDWVAYMQQVDMFLAGERDYSKIKGETGPLVYPTLHLFIYTALHWVLPAHARERPAQYIFLALYLLNFLSVSVIYYLAGRSTHATAQSQSLVASSKSVLANHSQHAAESGSQIDLPPPQALLIPLALSKREHSIYLLRLFNDPFAMAFLYLAIIALMLGGRRGWRIGSFLYSLALGVKMNILLFLPGLLVLLFQYCGLLGLLDGVAIIVAVQLLLPAPFFISISDPSSTKAYVTSAFDLSREFLYEWTVNWRFLSEHQFLSKIWARELLLAHLGLLVLFGLLKWSPVRGGSLTVLKRGLHPLAWTSRAIPSDLLPAFHIPLVLFTSNLIGIIFARSLHYQFHSWYFHQLPLLLFYGGAWGSLPIGIVLWAAIEWAWSTAPATPSSSGVMLSAHVIAVAGLLLRSTPQFKERLKTS